ncbi:MAG: AarF/ABC1/UbiB kinase family protein [Syntrophomonadaceae bacterium]|nr:AarF/ABC1/UbiB kinase family protein [Syntrophomonadaceae bacterium]
MGVNGLYRSWTIFRLVLGIIWEFGWERLQRQLRGGAAMDQRLPQLYRRQAVRLRETAIRMGGVLIKLGQFFSTRVDLLPREYTEELSRLQDEVTAIEAAEVLRVVEEELGRPAAEVFAWFDPRELAAASLGQVHRAELPGGEKLAVKVLRPKIEEIIAADLKTLQRVVVLVELLTGWGKRFDLWAIYREFSRTLLAELDYLQEGQNYDRFRSNFAQEPKVKTPVIYWEYTTRRVLTMEYLEGFKITQVEKWRQFARPAEMVELIIEAYIKQILEDGFFHADPHPGNIMVLPDGRLGLVDFGMVGCVTSHDKEALRQLVISLGSKNAPGIVSAFGELGFLRPETDRVVVRRALEQLIEEFGDQHIGEFSNQKWVEIMRELEEVVREQPFQIPSNFIFLGRTIGTLFGICVTLEPEARFFALLEPHLKRLALTETVDGERVSYINQAMSYAATLMEIPRRLQRTLTLAEEGNLHLKIDSPTLHRILRAQERSSRFLGRAVVFAGFLGASTILYVNGFRLEAHINFGLAILVSLILLFTWRGGERS